MSTAFNRPRADSDILLNDNKDPVSSNTRKIFPHLKTAVDKDTCCMASQRSRPIQTMTIAEMFTPAAAVWMAQKMAMANVGIKIAYQVTSLSIPRPRIGPMETPDMPISPNKPMTSLKSGRSVSVHVQ